MQKDRRGGLRRERDQELEAMAARALEIAERAENSVSTHERVCAERYKSILDRVSRIEWLIIAAVGVLLAGNALVQAISGQ